LKILSTVNNDGQQFHQYQQKTMTLYKIRKQIESWSETYELWNI